MIEHSVPTMSFANMNLRVYFDLGGIVLGKLDDKWPLLGKKHTYVDSWLETTLRGWLECAYEIV